MVVFIKYHDVPKSIYKGLKETLLQQVNILMPKIRDKFGFDREV